ncbi:PPOX class F420-dependent enzyme [Sphaerisporangium krabiense]|uniref:PPOX class probable F420-dependent enzyme n=1 Tax=Sphaerisporangium krabiense TaxID=763782 RepID=A0A7W9DSM9_9ACTN|nr:PPOX class F420-dependent oxidoreductase [Sphaerisporangium krabiense]MBB5629304.1 PPOX class probable F420-dependent enzyme [Sphaerisporangium krabiense]GII67078.1 PPOX class F420-dependent enzyme [Sphaerisporangium krabiense]
MSTAALPDHLLTALARPNPCVISTVRPDGAPVSVATWYLWEDGKVLVNMDAGRKRLDHLRADPRVSLTVLDSDSWYRHISLQGRVVSLEDDPDMKDIDRVSVHYTGEPYPNRERPRITGWIEIDSWHSWGWPQADQD